MTSIRVVFPFFGDRLGGNHISAVLLAEDLMTLGADVRFVLHKEVGDLQAGGVDAYLRKRGHSYDVIEVPEFDVERWATMADIRRDVASIDKTVVAYLNQNKIDIVHSHCRNTNCTWGAWAKKAGCLHVWHARNRIGNLKVEADLVARADVIIPSAKSIANTLPRVVQDRSLKLGNPIPSETPDEALVADIRHGLTGGEDMYLIGLFSQLDEKRKNADLFGDVVRKLDSIDGKPVKFVVGAHSTPEIVEKVQTYCFDALHRLDFVGFVDPVTHWMAAMDVVVVPAAKEPIGRASLEASSVGTPIVALNQPGIRETVLPGLNGFVVSGSNPDDFAYAVQYAIESDLKGRMRNTPKPVQRILTDHEPRKTAKKLFKQYEAALGHHSEKK